MPILVILIVALIVIFLPLAVIFALNTLFPILAIEYTFNTWLAALILFSGITYRK